MNYEYQSIFKEELDQFYEYKRINRYKNMNQLFYELKTLDHFFISEGLKSKEITKELVLKWNEKRSFEAYATRNKRTNLMRQFCTWLYRRNYSAYILPEGFNRNPSRYNPHIYTPEELRNFFRAIETYPYSVVCPYRNEMMKTYFFLLYTSGFRKEELCSLRLKDVHAKEEYVIIYGGKNNKDRIVPIHPEAARQMLALQEKYHRLSKPEEHFFRLAPGRKLTGAAVYYNFRLFLERAGISHGGKGAGPRIHDFRFTYVNHLLLKWVKEGKNLLGQMPYLKAMLGHKTYQETFYYLELISTAFPVILEKVEEAYGKIIREYEDDSTKLF